MDKQIAHGVRVSETQDFRLPAVDRAISLFELLANSQQGLTLSELSRRLSIPKSTTHYLLHTLITRGYVQRESKGRRYLLGLRLGDVAEASAAESNLRTRITPLLRKLTAHLGLTSTAGVQRGAESVIIARVESFHDSGGGAWVGRHIDLHCTAQGKVLLSTLSDKEIDKLLGSRELARFTLKTICSLASLKAHLADVRMNGFAVNDEEQVAGVRAVAIPIVDPIGSTVVSISVRGSTRQISRADMTLLARDMIFMAHDFANEMRERSLAS